MFTVTTFWTTCVSEPSRLVSSPVLGMRVLKGWRVMGNGGFEIDYDSALNHLLLSKNPISCCTMAVNSCTKQAYTRELLLGTHHSKPLVYLLPESSNKSFSCQAEECRSEEGGNRSSNKDPHQ